MIRGDFRPAMSLQEHRDSVSSQKAETEATALGLDEMGEEAMREGKECRIPLQVFGAFSHFAGTMSHLWALFSLLRRCSMDRGG